MPNGLQNALKKASGQAFSSLPQNPRVRTGRLAGIVVLMMAAFAISFLYREIRRPWVIIHRATEFTGSSQPDKAAALLHELTPHELENPRVRLHAAKAALDAGDLSLADNLLDPLLGNIPMDDLPLIYLTANILGNRHQSSQAIGLYQGYTAQGRVLDNASKLHLADLYRTDRQVTKADSLYRELLKTPQGTPQRRIARIHLAEMLAWQGKYAESLTLFREALTRHPDDREARLGYARALDWSGNHAASVDEFKKLLQKK